MSKFFDPLVLDPNTWCTRWSQIKGAPQEVSETFSAATSANPQHIAGLFTTGLRWALVPVHISLLTFFDTLKGH